MKGAMKRRRRRQAWLLLAALLPGAASHLPAGEKVGAEGTRPDVVLLMTDQQQGVALGVEDVPGLRTPAMDSLARRGLRFTRAYTATPQCSPARFAILSARYPHRTGVMGNVAGRAGRVPEGCSGPADTTIPTLGTVFAAAGYETAWYGKWHLGNDPGKAGFRIHAERRGRDERATRDAVALLEKRSPKPLLVVVSYLNPHDIYHDSPRPGKRGKPAAAREELWKAPLPVSLADDLSTKPAPQRRFREEDQGTVSLDYTPEDWRLYRYNYHLLVEKVDREVGKVLEAVERRGGNPIVVLTSDHGDLAGAHRLPYKCPAMYDELTRVPLIFAAPGRVRVGVSDALVSTMDILPTLCDLVGIAPPAGIDGLSLCPLLGDGAGRLERGAITAVPPSGRDAVVVEYYGKQRWRAPIRTLRTRRWKYNRYLRHGEELYDMESDPWEMRNLAGERSAAASLRALSKQLDQHMERTGDPFASLGTTDRRGKPER